MRKTAIAAATLALVLGMPFGQIASWADEYGSRQQTDAKKKDDLPFKGVRVAVLTGEGFQDAEALMPMAFLANRGAKVTVLGPERAKVKAYNSDILLMIHKAVADVAAQDFDLLVLPGGTAPDTIRASADVLKFTQEFFELGRPVAAICHGPQVLVAAGVVEGRKMTCYPGIADELREAAADYQDKEVVRDGRLITSRVPQDIPAWLSAIESMMADTLKGDD